ncbi:F-box/LRR-repeat protein 2-like isoform X2 [Leguminivora glycinivorella]|uniref:F-box/LRR-repeat protein 2-like isoform X2 n=1 Tax=Leguminivora glycinivorella TaxID=1035111 RepID=UPI00200D2E02|nr:F-box/LRR-repeat protein 2-like isoform X2 [Leguminivora glycinivorella]
MSPGKGEVNCSNGLTILDYLNEYCWRAVLDYVPVKDIISSERVSSHWQKTVLTYLSLSHVRLLVTYKDHYDCLGVMMEIPDVTSFEVDPDVWPSFLTWTYKCGSLVVGVHCICMETLNIISENCPKLEGLAMSDQCFTKFINCTNDLEELYICNNETMTGECLNNVRLRNLKSLIIGYSPELKFHHLVSAVDHFSKLKQFVLGDPTMEIHNKSNILVDKLPNLEYLHYLQRNVNYEFFHQPIDHFFNSVCGLENLKHLYVHGFLKDCDLLIITLCCENLHILELEQCDFITPLGLWCAWKIAGDRLTNLSLEDCLKVTEDDVVSCIRSCPKLTSLSIRNVLDLTPDLVSRADAARCEMRATVPLRLFVYNTEQNTSDNTERVVSEKHIIIDHSQRNYWV